MVTGNDSTDEEEDVGALIYREDQLRKAAEAAATASERKKITTASTHQRTSIRKRSPVTKQEKESLPILQRKEASKRK